MSTFRILFAAALIGAAALAANADDDVVRTTNGTVGQLEDDIRYHEDVVQDCQDSIAAVEARITVLREHLDSLNAVVKDVKSQITALEKEKKAYERDIKAATKARKMTFASRDNLVFDQQVRDVLCAPYNKLDVETALRSAEGMETKEVIDKMELVRNYGRYTQELRDFMEKQRPTFAKLNWATQAADSENTKKFHKALKGLSYYKIYEKGMKNAKNPSIPYLDKVIEEILVLERQGFNSRLQFDKVVDKLYGK
ncbi:MAG: hypothetical protein IJT30_03960 [Muribaculaceae bacterium]|nr:hypothetical protein [Muribaculaceae bacterium]